MEGSVLLRRVDVVDAAITRVAGRFGVKVVPGVGWVRMRPAPSCTRVGNLLIAYPDRDVFYIELKDIFGHQIYAFESDNLAPRVLDCGSHIGLSVLHLKKSHPDSNVTAFEPDPYAVSFLQENLRRNRVTGVEVVEAAVSDRAGTTFFRPDRDAGHVVTDTSDPSVVEVRTVRLRDYLVEEIDFLKMNIEGAELKVMRDCADELRKVDQIVVEYHGFAGLQQYLHEILHIFDEAGFRYLVHDFDRETNPATKPPFTLTGQNNFYNLVYARRAGK